MKRNKEEEEEEKKFRKNKINRLKRRLIKEEGMVLKAYKPDKNEKYYTIGVGHNGPDVKKDQKITKKQAENLLEKDIEKRLNQVPKAIKDFEAYRPELHDALFSSWFRGSLPGSPKTIKHLNKREYIKASKEFLDNEEYKGIKSGKGKDLPGVAERMERSAEQMKKQGAIKAKGQYLFGLPKQKEPKKQISRSPGSVMNTPQRELSEKELEELREQERINIEKKAAQVALLQKQQQIQAAEDQIQVEETSKDVVQNPELVAESLRQEKDLRPEQKEDLQIQSRNPARVAESAQNNISGEKRSGLKDQFMDALTYFGPQILAGLYGQSQEGDLGMVASMEAAGKMRDAYLDYNLQKRDREIREQQMQQGPTEYQQQSLEMRKKELEQRQKEEERRIETQKASLELREKGLSQSDIRIMETSAKNFIAKGTPAEREVSQLAEIRRVKDLIDSNAPFKGLLESAMAKGLGGEVGNLAVEERQAAAQIVGFKGKLANLQEFLTSNISKLRKDEIKKLLDFMEPKLRLRLSKRAERYAKSRSEMFNIDKQDYKNFLLESTGIGFDETQPKKVKKNRSDLDKRTQALLNKLNNL